MKMRIKILDIQKNEEIWLKVREWITIERALAIAEISSYRMVMRERNKARLLVSPNSKLEQWDIVVVWVR